MPKASARRGGASGSPRGIPVIENDALKAFAFDTYLPDETSPRFYIFHDLAELFGEEFNADALARLRRLLREHPENPRGKLTTDSEADFVSLSASKPDVIFLVAQLINKHAVPPHRHEFREKEYAAVLAAFRGWERRRPTPWRVGDPFQFRMCDGSLGYGQVLSVLHLGGDLLDKGRWEVLGNAKIVASPKSGPFGRQDRIGGVSWGFGRAAPGVGRGVLRAAALERLG